MSSGLLEIQKSLIGSGLMFILRNQLFVGDDYATDININGYECHGKYG